MRPEVNLLWTRSIFMVAGLFCIVLVNFMDWPAADDFLIPRSPYGKLEPIGRAGDFILLCGVALFLVGTSLSGRRTVGSTLMGLGFGAVLGASVAFLVAFLRITEPNAYDSIALRVVAGGAFLTIPFSVQAFLRVRQIGVQREGQDDSSLASDGDRGS